MARSITTTRIRNHHQIVVLINHESFPPGSPEEERHLSSQPTAVIECLQPMEGIADARRKQRHDSIRRYQKAGRLLESCHLERQLLDETSIGNENRVQMIEAVVYPDVSSIPKASGVQRVRKHSGGSSRSVSYDNLAVRLDESNRFIAGNKHKR
jgi:hypothetical protein